MPQRTHAMRTMFVGDDGSHRDTPPTGSGRNLPSRGPSTVAPISAAHTCQARHGYWTRVASTETGGSSMREACPLQTPRPPFSYWHASAIPPLGLNSQAGLTQSYGVHTSNLQAPRQSDRLCSQALLALHPLRAYP